MGISGAEIKQQRVHKEAEQVRLKNQEQARKAKEAELRKKLKKCEACHGPVSKRAAFCPRCGDPQTDIPSTNVTIKKLDMSLDNTFIFAFKFAIAMIPCAIIAGLMWSILAAILAGVGIIGNL